MLDGTSSSPPTTCSILACSCTVLSHSFYLQSRRERAGHTIVQRNALADLSPSTMGSQVQVISAQGEYESGNVQAFLEQNNLGSAGVGYTTVAIMGPQSSGKSTLLNTLVRSLDSRTVSVANDWSCLMHVWRHPWQPAQLNQKPSEVGP